MSSTQADERTPLLASQATEASQGVARTREVNQEVEAPWKPSTRLRFVQAVTFCNVFLAGFDSTVAASTYTSIASDFGEANNAVWVSTSYLVTATAFQPLYGRLSDILGRRIAFLFGTSVFSLGTLLCAISTSMLTLNLARALAGIGGGGLMTMSTVILSDSVPLKHRGLYQSANNLMYGLGAACGASAGGVIAHALGWRLAFALQLPVSLAAVVGGFLLVQDPMVAPLPRDAPVDVAGAVSLVFATATLLLALSMGGNEVAWTSAVCLGLFAAAFALFALFLIVEERAAAPILPRRMLTGSLAISNVLTNVFSGTSVYAFLFSVPLFFIGGRLEATDVVGTRLILPALGFPIGAIAAGYVMSRFGLLGPLVQSGCVVLLIGSLLPPLLFTVEHGQAELLYFAALLPVQIGQGLINPSSLFTMIAAFPHRDQAVATSTVYLARSLGNVAGVALAATVLQNYLRLQLPVALDNVDNADELFDAIRHSTDAITQVPIDHRLAVQQVYGQGVRLSILAAGTLTAALSLISSFWARGVGLERQDA